MTSPSEGKRQRVRSYGGAVVEARVHTPRTVSELREVLRAARAAGSRVTFRGGGCAFDTQSLNDDVVIAMTAMTAINLDVQNATVTAESGATWGDIVRRSAPHGLVPAALVTTRNATVAGTASADCLSRFSPTVGKEGAHVESFDLLTVGGTLLHCTRTENADVFFGAIGGLGYLGAITRVTYRLLRLGYAPRVETVLTPYRSLREFLRALLPKTGEALALYGAFSGQRAIHFRGRYVPATGPRRPLWLLHQPRSVLRALFELAVRAQPLTRLGSWLTFTLASGKPRVHVDDFEDYAFFMDGNALAKSIGQAFGAPMRTLQQTFLLPVQLPDGPEGDAGLERSLDQTIHFLETFSAELRAARIQPTMLDCLFLPRDEDFYLSSSAGQAGFAFSAAFDTSNEALLSRVRSILTAASARCRAIGGRVHLVKNVCAAPEDLAAMYGEGAERFFALKRRLDPQGMLRNEFLERVFPAVAEAAVSRAEGRSASRSVPRTCSRSGDQL
ncbi:MAG TPA: FAD-binding oxidoreductase [Polyangiaceae bacterium]|jgi:decaprenylphospho-beta-D-ribofuranose 2-oxidase